MSALGWVFEFASRRKSNSSRIPSEADLRGFLAAQNLARQATLTVSKEIKEGWTEAKAAELLETYLRDHGISHFFHRCFAWFGERSRFSGMKGYRDFLPSSRALSEGDVGILDVAPVVNGYLGDVGFSFSLGPSEPLERAKAFLGEIRKELPRIFEEAVSPGEVWIEIERRMTDAGFENCYKLYPFSVLGHRVYRLKSEPAKRLAAMVPLSFMSWFSLRAQLAFLENGVFSEILTRDHRGEKAGLWAIEPHLGADGFGAKFEEILLVTESGARWIDPTPQL